MHVGFEYANMLANDVILCIAVELQKRLILTH
jgi:hypothetical protein